RFCKIACRARLLRSIGRCDPPALSTWMRTRATLRASAATPSHNIWTFSASVICSPLLEAFRLALDFLEGGAFGQPKVHQDLGTVGGREELLWNEAEARHTGAERGEGQCRDEPPPTHRPGAKDRDRARR